jgi:CTP-dependent riboflavin kinase
MAHELDRSMRAIAQNSLPSLEDSVSNQQAIAERLRELADELSKPPQIRSAALASQDDESLIGQIHGAAETLQTLNKRYSALLKHSSHSVALMVSLFSSFRGQIQEGAGPGLKQATWSCQV